MEEYAYVLDYLPNGTGRGRDRNEPLCYAMGESEFKLFELVAKPGAVLNFDDRIYIGKDAGKRSEIDHVKRRISYDDLTSTAQGELEYVIGLAVKKQEARFIKFYNEVGPISLRKHGLEELPGLGKKSMTAILDQREKARFKDFADMEEKVPVVKNPDKLIVARVLLEISDPNRKRYIFTSR